MSESTIETCLGSMHEIYCYSTLFILLVQYSCILLQHLLLFLLQYLIVVRSLAFTAVGLCDQTRSPLLQCSHGLVSRDVVTECKTFEENNCTIGFFTKLSLIVIIQMHFVLFLCALNIFRC